MVESILKIYCYYCKQTTVRLRNRMEFNRNANLSYTVLLLSKLLQFFSLTLDFSHFTFITLSYHISELPRGLLYNRNQHDNDVLPRPDGSMKY